MAKTYKARCARDAQASGYGSERYWDELEASSLRHHDYYVAAGNPERAALMLTQSLGEALEGNDGD